MVMLATLLLIKKQQTRLAKWRFIKTVLTPVSYTHLLSGLLKHTSKVWYLCMEGCCNKCAMSIAEIPLLIIAILLTVFIIAYQNNSLSVVMNFFSSTHSHLHC